MILPAKLLIVAAGQGKRLGPKAVQLHKALWPIRSRPVLSHILDRFPGVPVVMAVGHLSDQLREFMALAYPERDVVFVEVPDYDKPGSGPGASALACRAHLKGPFYFSTVDTLTRSPIPGLSESWIGCAPIESPESFCTLRADSDGLVESFADKEKGTSNRLAFIGLAGIADAPAFWRALESDESLISGERQVSSGLKGLLAEGLRAVTLDWQDTGSWEGYSRCREQYEEGAFDFSKSAEETYVLDERVIKWFAEPRVTAKRAERGRELGPYVPRPCGVRNQFFAYEKARGRTVYDAIDRFDCGHFLHWLQSRFWSEEGDRYASDSSFRAACLNFYRDKTLSRLDQFFTKNVAQDESRVVNGERVPAVREMLDRLDWSGMVDRAIPSRFHGDLQFDNVLMTEGAREPFLLIDWRQDFGGLNYGDRYYDLAKLGGGLSLNYLDIKKGKPLSLEASPGDAEVRVGELSSDRLRECRKTLVDFCERQGYDTAHVTLITALIYLNMAPLHAAPFDRFLYFFGQLRLAQAFTGGAK